MDRKNKNKDKKVLVFEEKIIFFFCILAGLLSLLAIYVTVADVVNRNTNNNNCISAYAVEEEIEILCPRPSSGSVYGGYIAFDYSNDTFTYNTANRGGGSMLAETLYYDNGKIYYRARQSNSNDQIFVSNNLNILDYGISSLDSLNLLNRNDYVQSLTIDGATSLYWLINLSDFEYNFFIIASSGNDITYYPNVLFERISEISSMPENIIFDTTHTLNLNRLNIFNQVDYGSFKICHVNFNAGINGFTAGGAVRQTRNIYYLTSENRYQEGYNSGYDAGYRVGYDDAFEMNRFNPFEDTFVMGASVMAYQHGGEIQSNLGASGYEYTQYGIKNTQSLKDWLTSQTLEEYAPYITYYRIGVSLTNSSHSGVELNDESELYIGFYNSDDEFTNTLTENLDVYMVLRNANSNSSISLSFTLYSGSNAVIDFSNINGVDYSGYYFRDIDIRKTTIFSHDIYEFRFSETLGTYQQGYKNGYNAGISKSNYQNGYNQGYADASNNNGYTFFSLIGAVIDAPITYFTSLFDYEILGTNIKGFLLALLTIGIALAVIRISLAKK